MAAWSLVDLQGPGHEVTPRLEAEAIIAIHAALDCGVRMFDTARAYTTSDSLGHSEQLLQRALRSHPAGSEALVATKAGHERVGLRYPDDFPVQTDARTIRRHLRTSLELLERDAIWLLQLHWPPPDGSVAEAMHVFADLVAEGLVQNVGVCNVSLEQVRQARSSMPLASVQNHFSPLNVDDRAVVDYCAENMIAYLAYSPLGGNARDKPSLSAVFPQAEQQARERGLSVETLALAWLLAQSPTLIPISGASSPATVRASAKAAAVALTPAEASSVGF